MAKIACIDDCLSNLEYSALVLGGDYEVELFEKPSDFLKIYGDGIYAAIIIDIHMPEMNGFDLYEKILEHPQYKGCPVLFISSDESEISRIKSYSLGAVDFLGRQLGPAELLSRVKSKILFFEKNRTVLEFGEIKLDLTLLKAHVGNQELKVTFTEFKLLSCLIKNYPDFLNKEDLVEKIWGNGVVLDATLYTHLFNLNCKLEKWDYEVGIERNKGLKLYKRKPAP